MKNKTCKTVSVVRGLSARNYSPDKLLKVIVPKGTLSGIKGMLLYDPTMEEVLLLTKSSRYELESRGIAWNDIEVYPENAPLIDELKDFSKDIRDFAKKYVKEYPEWCRHETSNIHRTASLWAMHKLGV